jgi:Cys-tRNA(Pro) deacylase
VARKSKVPRTPALRALDAAKVGYTVHQYDYVDKGGTRASSAALGVDEHALVKTLIFETDAGRPLIICQHGDRRVSGKRLARVIGEKRVQPCEPSTAQRHTGYKVGGTSPFGTRKRLPLYVERSVLELPAIFINGGGRGLLVELDPNVLVDVFGAVSVDAAQD